MAVTAVRLRRARALTRREREFWDLLRAGKSHAEIAAGCRVTVRTVYETLREVMSALNMPRRPYHRRPQVGGADELALLIAEQARDMGSYRVFQFKSLDADVRNDGHFRVARRGVGRSND